MKPPPSPHPAPLNADKGLTRHSDEVCVLSVELTNQCARVRLMVLYQFALGMAKKTLIYRIINLIAGKTSMFFRLFEMSILPCIDVFFSGDYYIIWYTFLDLGYQNCIIRCKKMYLLGNLYNFLRN